MTLCRNFVVKSEHESCIRALSPESIPPTSQGMASINASVPYRPMAGRVRPRTTHLGQSRPSRCTSLHREVFLPGTACANSGTRGIGGDSCDHVVVPGRRRIGALMEHVRNAIPDSRLPSPQEAVQGAGSVPADASKLAFALPARVRHRDNVRTSVQGRTRESGCLSCRTFQCPRRSLVLHHSREWGLRIYRLYYTRTYVFF
ncbi:hypothetical protein BD413DRAFT_294063 [Trametes elegans]|nr:hypothetical protein BD413DRAFT_294063 [Trametes elegans]